MFEAQLNEGKTFKAIIEAIKDLVQDCNLDCSEEEVAIQSMDSAHVSLVAVRLSAGGFSNYRCDRPNSLGINTGNMSKILKMLGKDDSITFKAEDESPDTLTMLFEGGKTTIADFGKFPTDFIDLTQQHPCNILVLLVPYVLRSLKELKLMDIETEQLGIPDTAYQCTVQMNADEFQRIVRDLQVLGDTCTIACGKEGIRFSVSGAMGNGNILIRSNDDENEKDRVTITMDEPVELNFALRYLNFFTKATPLSSTVIISMSPDVPVVVEYPIEDYGHIKFYLAPKIEEE